MGSLRIGLIVLISLSAAWAAENEAPKKDITSPIISTILCPFRAEPWTCMREQAGRMLVLLDVELQAKSKELHAEADAELAKNMQARGFSATEMDPREKPSSVMQSVEDTLDTLTDGVEELIADRGEAESDKKKKKKMKMKMKKKKKPSSGHHEEEDDHEVIEWEEPEDLDFEVAQGHGHKHGQEEIKDAVDVTVHADENEEDEEVEESGRFNGEVRGKKKKKKKALMKLLVLGAVLKAKIEMLLKILSFKLQLKFLAIAAIGLLINLARFWVDVKKSHHPQKVIYYEHAQHQHHYDEHGGDDGWGGYWKRSLNVGEPSNEDDTYYSTNHYNPPAAYTGQVPAARPAAYQGASELAYNRQIPQTRYV